MSTCFEQRTSRPAWVRKPVGVLIGVGVLSQALSCFLTNEPATPSESQLVIATQPSATATSGTAFGQQPAIQLRDVSGGNVSKAGVVITASLATGGGTLGGGSTATTNSSGLATFTDLRITGVLGTRTLSFTSGTLTGATSTVIDVNTAGAETQVLLATQPSATATSGAPFGQQPVLQLRDISGNSVSKAGVVISASIATGGGTLSGTSIATTSASGVATFTDLRIIGVLGTRTLSFTSGTLTGATSNAIDLNAAGAETQLFLTTQPSATATNGTALGQQPALQLRDISGNNVNKAGVVVTAGIATGGGTLGGTSTATTNTSGVATFTDLRITGALGNRTLSFTSGTLTGATSNSIDVNGAGNETQLFLATQPSTTATSGAAFGQQPAIQLRDISGNNVNKAGVVITAGIATGGGTLGGTSTATTNTSGVATFTDLRITGVLGSRTLSFTSGTLTGATSNAIDVNTAGAETQLFLATQPSATATSGAAFSQQPAIQLRDISGNNVSREGVVITVGIATGGGALGGTSTATTNTSGLATFTDLRITGVLGTRTLSFTSGTLTGATSNGIDVNTAGTETQLFLATQPSATATSGAAFGQQPAIQLRDVSGNNVSKAGVVITAGIATGGGTLGGTLMATTDADGVATFTDLSIAGLSGDRTLSFSAGALTGTTSNTISVTAPVIQFTLTVSVNGDGTVTSSPPGINCPGGPCSSDFASGTDVTLLQTPSSGWTFGGWSGACGGAGSCTVAMNAATAVTASFENRDLYLSSLSAPSTGTIGSTIAVSTVVTNQGNAASSGFRIGYYYSVDATITTSDTYSGSMCLVSNLAPGSDFTCTLAAASVPGSLTPGTYHVGAIADDLGQVLESVESNNARAASSTTVLSPMPSDLVPQSLARSPTSGAPGATVNVTFTVHNQGTGTANASTANIRLSTSSTAPSTGDPLLATISIPSLAGGASHAVNQNVTIPGGRSAGSNYLWVILDVNSTANQSVASNDSAAIAFTVTPAQSDLVALSLARSPTTGPPGWDPLESTCRHASLSIL